MRKKLDTRFPAARIKKIMQADEDIGKIAMAVPLLVSKALELFLQDLCDRTYEITLRRGAKTMNSFHLKQCVQTFNVFDFLKDIVSKVPDLGGHVATGNDSNVCKRRKVDDDGNDSKDDPKRNKMPEHAHHAGGRGRGRGRGRGYGRGSRTAVDREMTAHVKFEDDRHHPDILKQNDMHTQSNESMENGTEHEEVKPLVRKTAEVSVRNFDLNMDPDEEGDSPASLAPIQPNLPEKLNTEFNHEEFPGWSLSDVEKMAIDPMQLVNLNGKFDDEEEDYDEGC